MSGRAVIEERIDTYFDALGRADIDAVLDCYAPGATIEVVAPGPLAGLQPASREGLEALYRAIPEITFEVLGVIVDGDRAAVEVRSEGRLANGKPYRNRYHDFFRFEDGRIAEFREYPTFPAGS